MNETNAREMKARFDIAASVQRARASREVMGIADEAKAIKRRNPEARRTISQIEDALIRQGLRSHINMDMGKSQATGLSGVAPDGS